MDIDTIEQTYRHFHGRVRHELRLGHQPHQRFPRLRTRRRDRARAISLVCKVTRANGRPAVKLSDNPAKATGTAGKSRAICASSAAPATFQPVLV